ncbi:MAG: hypothetical protein QXR57_03085 [Metallosphaera sp.]|uniref:hypothetical protein n=1 Tax=Metallosphaera TaxID=41980 RepID=UPI00064F98DB|nr:hypothetical protein [Metallosphaera cuprina]
MKVKLRIDKLPKTDEDLEEIQREVEGSHNEHHHGESDLESVLGELYVNYQNLDSKVKELEQENEKLKREVATLYKVISKAIVALTAENQEDKRKTLSEMLSLLNDDNR